MPPRAPHLFPFVGLLALAPLLPGCADDVDPDEAALEIEGVAPGTDDATLAPGSSLAPDADVAPEADLRPSRRLAPDDTLREELPAVSEE